ncbi:MAG TPA: cell division protein FtsL [Rugosibacter sp.]
MARLNLNLMLLLVVVICALSVVKTNHQSRKLFIALEAEQKHLRDLNIEWGQLQLEQSTWAANVRVETLAREKLGMKRPAPGDVMSIDDAKSDATAIDQTKAKPLMAKPVQ